MSTVASLQVKIGADVSAAINGMAKADFAAQKVAESFAVAAEKSVKAGFVVAGWAANFATAIDGISQKLEGIDVSKLAEGDAKTLESFKKISAQASQAANTISAMGAAFSGAQQIAIPAMAAIARAVPAMAGSLAAAAGPITLVVGVLAAMAAGFVASQSAMKEVNNEAQKLRINIIEEQAAAAALFEQLQSSNTTQERRKELIDKVNETYGTTLKNLGNEKEYLKAVGLAYDDVIKSIEAKLILQSKTDAIEKLLQERIELDSFLEIYKTLPETIGKANAELLAKGASPGQLLPDNLFGDPAYAQARRQKITDQINALISDINKYKTISKPEKETGSKGKKQITEGDLSSELIKGLTDVSAKFAAGLIPVRDVLDKEIDVWSGIINKAFTISPAAGARFADSFKTYLAEATGQGTALEIPLIPRLPSNPEFLTQIPPLADRMREAVEEKMKKIKITIDDTNTSQQAQNFAKQFEKEIEGIQQVSGIADQLGKSIFGAIEAASNLDGKRAELEEYYDRESELIDASIGSEALKNQKKAAMEKDLNAKRKALAKEEAKQNKAKAIFEATINTANAVSKALATGGPPLAAIVSALGLVQIGAIAAQPLPLASGGLAYGPTAALVGEYPGASSNPEFISPVDKAKKYIREAVTEAGAGAREMFSIIRNDDLILITARGQYNNRRLR